MLCNIFLYSKTQSVSIKMMQSRCLLLGGNMRLSCCNWACANPLELETWTCARTSELEAASRSHHGLQPLPWPRGRRQSCCELAAASGRCPCRDVWIMRRQRTARLWSPCLDHGAGSRLQLQGHRTHSIVPRPRLYGQQQGCLDAHVDPDDGAQLKGQHAPADNSPVK